MISSTINNRYRIIKKLGEGGMGDVYLVTDTLHNDQQVALKTIKKEITNSEILKGFKKEFEVMTRLKHPNLARVYDFGIDRVENIYYITMEYVKGISLKDLLYQRKSLPSEEVLNIIVSLCRSLEFMHSRNILHRDIKPGNIMLTENGIKVMDFGLADLEQTERYHTKGTLFYIAPEVLKGQVDNRADIYSLGVTFYELMTGEVLYSKHGSKTIVSILKDIKEFYDSTHIALNKIENIAIREIISKMTEYKIEDRYRFCSEIILEINKKLKKNYELETKETKEAYILGAGFVGRKEELSKLISELETGKCQQKMILVRGRMGVGKSRLYQEFKKYCQLCGIIFIEGNCMEQIFKAYTPFLDILNEVLLDASMDSIKIYGPELKKILPYNDKLKDIEVNPSYDPKTEKDILVQTITNFLLNYGKEQRVKVVIYLNDLQWSDEGSLDVIKELMYKLSHTENLESNLRIYASVREEEINNIDKALNILREKGRLEEIILTPFNATNVGNYIEAIFGKDYIDDSLRNVIPVIESRIGGNPLFLQELVKTLVEEEFIIRCNLKWETKGLIQQMEIPGSLRAIIKTRLNKMNLNPDDERCLQILALIGRGVSIEEFKNILFDKVNSDVDKLFAEMERRELLVAENVEGRVEYRFAHNLMREAMVETITNEEDFHIFIANRFEIIYEHNLDEHIEELAFHYSKTNIEEKALFYLEKAGDKCKANYTNDEAVYYYDRLLEWLGKKDKERSIKVLFKKGEILDLTGKWDMGIEVYKEALNLSEEIADKSLIGRSKNNIGVLLRKKGDYKSSLELFEDALKIFTDLEDKINIGTVMNDIGYTYWCQGDYSKSMEYYKKCLSIFESMNDKRGISQVMGNMGLVYWNQGEYSESMKCYERQLKIVEELNDKRTMGINLGKMGMVYWNQGNYAEAIKCYERKLKIAEELGDKREIGIAVGNIGIVYYGQGNYSKAMEYYKRQLSIAEELGDKRTISLAIGNMGSCYMDQGNYEKAMEHFQRQLSIVEELGDKPIISLALCNMGDAYKRLKKYAESEGCYNKAIGLGKELQLKYYLAEYINHMADLYYSLERFEESEKLNNEAETIAKEINQQDTLFSVHVLSAKIKFYRKDNYQNKEKGIAELKKMLSVANDERQIAILNYELYKMTKDNVYFQEALKLHKELYKKTPCIDYKSIIDELEREIIENSRQIENKISKFEGSYYNGNPCKQIQLHLNTIHQELMAISNELSNIDSSTDKMNYFTELLEIIRELNSNLILDRLLERIVDLSIKFIHSDRGIIMLYNYDGKLETRIARNSKGENLKDEEYKVSKTVIKKVIETNKPLFVSEVMDDELLASASSIIDMELRSVMCIPLGRRFVENTGVERRQYSPYSANQLIGILYVDSKSENKSSRFTESNIELLQALADQASIALINAMLYEKTNIDSLTHLYLRPYFEDSLKNEIRLSREINTVLSLMMIDIDFFKSINDRWGHQSGDDVLKEIGRIFLKTLRASDICARYGGDEFAIILPNTDISQAKCVAMKLIETVKSTCFSFGNITISIGISCFPESVKNIEPSLQVDYLIKYADQALYYAKDKGRNCYEIWNESIPETSKVRNQVTDILTGDPIRDYRNVQMLLEAIKATSSTLDLNELLIKILDMIIEITGTERGILMLLDEEKQKLKVYLARTNSGENIEEEELVYSQSIPYESLKRGEAMFFKDVSDDIATTSMMDLSLRSVLCIPLQIRDKQFGVIYVDSRSALNEFTNADLSFFRALTDQITGAIENAQLHTDALEKERLTQELEVAREIQMSLLPQNVPQIPGLDVAGIMKTAKEVGGDYYDFILSSDKNKFYIAIGDVSGKGVPAGMIMTMVKSSLQLLVNTYSSTRDILVQLNQIIDNNTDDTKFMTFLLLCWDIKEQRLFYTNAGHERIIVCRASGELEIIKQSKGLALGMLPDIESRLEENELQLSIGDTIILYTDGVTEARDIKKDMLTFPRWCEIIKKHCRQNSKTIIQNLLNDIGEHIGKAPQYDDITIVVATRV